MKKINFVFLSATLFAFGCSSGSQNLCANEIKREIVSPDNALKAVIFERNCPANDASARVTLAPPNENLSNEDEGNIFISNQSFREAQGAPEKRANVEVRWLDEKQLIVSFDDISEARPTRMRQQYERVKIIYDMRRVEKSQQTN